MEHNAILDTSDTSYYKLAVENVPLHIILTDPEGIILYANDAVTEITGYSKEEVIGQRPSLWGQQMPPEYYQKMWHTIKDLKEIHIGEITNKKKDGTTYTAYVKIAPVLNLNNEITGYVGIEQDITEQKENKKTLEIFHSILQESTDLILLIDFKKHTIIQANKVAQELLKIPQESLGNLTVDDINNLTLRQDDKELIFHDVILSLPQEREYILEGTITQNDEKIPFEFNIAFVQYNEEDFALATARSTKHLDNKIVLGLGRNITQRKETERRIKDFTSIVSHQLRTPLGGERWVLEMLLNDEYGSLSEEVKKHLQTLYQNKLDMIDLISTLLDVSRLEKGKSIRNPEFVAIGSVIDTAINKLSPMIEEKGMTITLNIENDNETVYVDCTRVTEVITSLLSNALKYTPNKKTVTITTKLDDTLLALSITDEGIGISDQDKKQLFKRFFRGEQARNVSIAGSGLGLFFVKLCVDEWGGTVSVESQDNVGSTFTITIPTKKHE